MSLVIPTAAGLPGNWTYLYGDPMTLQWDSSGFRSRVVFETTLANLSAFVLYIGGNSQVITTTSGQTFNRIVPMAHPYFTGLYAYNIECEAFGTPSATDTSIGALWSNAKVAVDFHNLPYGFTGDTPFMEWNVDEGATYTTVPGRQFKFPSGEPLSQDAGAFAVLNNYSLTLYQCPTLNDATIDSLAGCYNQAVFFGRPAGSMLMGPCKSNFKVMLGGVSSYQRTLSFIYRSYHWNQAYQSNGVLDTPIDPAGNPQYNPGDFSQLFN